LSGEPSLASSQAPRVSVVVCTRDRPELLRSCLAALLKQTRSDFEVLVVDNAPSDGSTEMLCAELPVRYLREPQPGLARARNLGIRHATADIVAFTDDDTVPDAAWIQGLAAAFSDQRVMAVTGRVEAAELESAAQRYFENAAGGMSKGATARLFVGRSMNVFDLISAQSVGVGANMAVRREVFEKIGTFDTRLGTGTAARGAEDIDMFHRILAAGLTLRYEPAALVHHRHRRDMAGLRQQLFDAGCGFGVYLLLLASKGTVPRSGVVRYVAGRWVPWLWGRLLKGLVHRHSLPLPLLWAQLAGALQAPAAYRAVIAERPVKQAN